MNEFLKLTIVSLALTAAKSAHAQDVVSDTITQTPPSQAESPQSSRNSLIQEVVVTAQKREENIQDVPVSITAFNAEQLSALGVTNTKQLGLVTPGLQFSEIAGFTLVYLRGIGTDSFLPYADPAVATYVDGLYIPAQQGLINGLGGVERVEVLKGPQGTLFGRNATGGAIDVHTKSPGQKSELSINSELGNFNDRKAQLYGNVPLTDTLAVNVSAVYNYMDPYYHTANDNCLLCEPSPELQADRSEGLRVKIRWTPTDRLDFSLAGLRLLQQGSGSTIAALKYPSLLARALGINGDPNDYEIQRNEPTQLRVDNSTVYGNAKWSLPWFDLKLIAGIQNIRTEDAFYDYDESQKDLVSFFTHNAYNVVQTQEFQIASNDSSWMGDRFKWIAGFYHLHSIGGYDPISLQVAGSGVPLDGLFGLVTPAELSQLANLPVLGQIPALTIEQGPGVKVNIHGVLRTRSYSGFAQGSYDITNWFGVTVGGRYQVEDRFLVKQFVTLAQPDGGEVQPPLFNYSAPIRTQYNFSPKLSFNFKPFQGGLLYLSASKGYQSGTYNGINIYTPPTYVQPERVEAFEIGAKTEFLGGQIRLNGAVFDNEIKNQQVTFVSLTNGGAITFENAPGARVRGAEFDAIWQFLPVLDPGVVFTAGGSYLDSYFTKYPNASGYSETTGLFESKTLNFDGNRIARSPKVSGNVGLNQIIATDADSGTYELGADAYYNSGFFFTAQNTPEARQGTYYLLNAHAGYTYEPWRAKITLFGQNLNGRRYSFASFTEDFGTATTLAPPRTFGLRLGWEL